MNSSNVEVTGAEALKRLQESEALAKAFQEKFDKVQSDLRRSLEDERLLVERCKELSEALLERTKALEVVYQQSTADQRTINQLRQLLLAAEQRADVAQLREVSARRELEAERAHVARLQAQVGSLTETVARLRQSLSEAPRPPRPEMPVSPGPGASPFDRWKVEAGVVTVGDSGGRHGLSAEGVHRLGHMAPSDMVVTIARAEYEQMRNSARQTSIASVRRGSALGSTGLDGSHGGHGHGGHGHGGHGLEGPGEDDPLAAPGTVTLIPHPFWSPQLYADSGAVSVHRSPIADDSGTGAALALAANIAAAQAAARGAAGGGSSSSLPLVGAPGETERQRMERAMKRIEERQARVKALRDSLAT